MNLRALLGLVAARSVRLVDHGVIAPMAGVAAEKQCEYGKITEVSDARCAGCKSKPRTARGQWTSRIPTRRKRRLAEGFSRGQRVVRSWAAGRNGLARS